LLYLQKSEAMARPREENVQVNVTIGDRMAGKTLTELNTLSKSLNKELKALVPGTDAFKKKAAEIKEVNEVFADVKEQVKGTKDNISAMTEEMTKLGPGAGLIDRFKAGFQGLKQGLDIGVKGFGSLRGAIAGTGIGLLLIAFASLVSYFKLTDEGSEKLERAMAALKAIFNVLLGRVVEFGKFLMNAIENPVESIKKLGQLIMDNLINRVKAFAVIWDAIKSGNLQAISDGVIQLGTGITDASGKLKNFVNGVKELATEAMTAADAAAELTRRTQELEDAERDLSVINERRKGQIDQLLLAFKDQSLSDEQRIANLKLAGQIEQQMTDDSLRLAQERFDIIKAENALKEKQNLLSDDDKDAQAQAEIALIQIMNQSAMLRQQIANKESAALKDLANERKKLLDDQRKAQEEYNKKLLEAQRTLEDLQLEGLEDGLIKRLTKIQQSYNQESAEIRRNIEDTEKNEKISLAQRAKLIEVYKQQQIQLEKNFAKETGDVRAEAAEKEIQRELAIRNKADLAKADLEILNARENSDRLLEARLEKLDIEKEIELQNKALTEEEKALIEAEYVAKSEALYKEHAEKRVQYEQMVKDAALGLAKDGLQAIVEFGAIQTEKQIAEAERVKNERVAKLDQELKSKKINQDTYDSQKAKAEQEFNEKQKKLKTEQAKKEKAVAVTMATIDTILGVVKALSSAPPPLNFVLAAITGAAGALNIAKIASTPLPTFAKGGVVRGASHREGGIAMIERKSGRELGELEGNEIIMTGGVTRNPHLRAAASRINEAGGGRTFEAGGIINPLSTSIASTDGGSAKYSAGGALIAGGDGAALVAEMRATRQAVERIPTNIKAYIVYSEFEETQASVEAVRSDASLS
jgi:hypothetical protein